MDPLSIAGAIGVATKAFNTIKQGFAIGQDIDQMARSNWKMDVCKFLMLTKQKKKQKIHHYLKSYYMQVLLNSKHLRHMQQKRSLNNKGMN